MREAPSLVLIEKILKAGGKVRVFDPVAMEEARKSVERQKMDLSENIYYSRDIYDAVLDADALLVVTEWKEFRLPTWGVVKKSMRGNLVLDGRNIYEKTDLLEMGLVYEGIGI